MSRRTSARRSISRIVSPPSPMRTPMRSCGTFTCFIHLATRRNGLRVCSRMYRGHTPYSGVCKFSPNRTRSCDRLCNRLQTPL
ncbi:hypothetical protein [Halobellus sp. Atlit-38R]|uniref:hypothetical protein n=1 Tax=Halobellus sp. Atlit-38R TaxID=2282131 RepID=UPI003742E2F7